MDTRHPLPKLGLAVSPGDGFSWLFAQRPFQIAFHEAPFGPETVVRPTPTLVAISSSLTPASAASKICARLSLRAACLPPLRRIVSSARSVWLISTRYIQLYTRLHRRPPAETDMQQYFCISPPSVHQMVLTLERAGFIRRQARVARSIELLIDPKCLLELL